MNVREMKTSQKIAEGLLIISKYSNSDWDTGAAHDILFAGFEDLKVPEDEQKRLKELGWFLHENGSWAIYA
tara:strand:+ start:8599 stop:8811 length:213 start_codon:yes stop_codon:yes gene_type:complete